MTSHPDVLAELSAAGVAIWLDDISRERLTSGNLAALVRDRHVVGVTSNPTIFDHALSHGDAYNEQLADLALRGVSVDEASRAITSYDVRWACDVLRPVYDATDGVDGRVSLEVDPRLAGRHREDHRRGPRPVVAGGPAEPVHQDPGHPCRAARDHPVPGRGDQRQRDADLLAGAVRRGHRRLLHRAGAGRRGRPRPGLDGVGGVVLRQPGGHRGGQQAGQDRHPGGGRAARQGRRRQRPARLRALRAAVRHAALVGAAGQGRPPPAAAVGLDQHQGPGLPGHHVRGRTGRARTR